MKSVAHVLSSLSLGGAERMVTDLAEIQRDSGINAQVVSLGCDKDFLVAKIRSLNIPLKIYSPDTSRLRRYAALIGNLRKFNIVHVHSRGAFKFISPILPFLFCFGVRVIYTRHGLLADRQRGTRILYRLFKPFVKNVTFVTESGRDVFLDNHSWNPAKLLVIRNGIKIPEQFEKADSTATLRMGSVGRMEPLKGQLTLLNGLQMLEESTGADAQGSLVLKFFGEGPLEDELRKRSRAFNKIKIEFCGQEPDRDKVYREIDLLIVSSDSEGLSMVILEAMSRRIPVIATDVGGNSTLVRNGRTGILVSRPEASLLRDAVLTFIDNPELIGTYGNNARSMIEEEFSLQRTHEKYLECYGF